MVFMVFHNNIRFLQDPNQKELLEKIKQLGILQRLVLFSQLVFR